MRNEEWGVRNIFPAPHFFINFHSLFIMTDCNNISYPYRNYIRPMWTDNLFLPYCNKNSRVSVLIQSSHFPCQYQYGKIYPHFRTKADFANQYCFLTVRQWSMGFSLQDMSENDTYHLFGCIRLLFHRYQGRYPFLCQYHQERAEVKSRPKKSDTKNNVWPTAINTKYCKIITTITKNAIPVFDLSNLFINFHSPLKKIFAWKKSIHTV